MRMFLVVCANLCLLASAAYADDFKIGEKGLITEVETVKNLNPERIFLKGGTGKAFHFGETCSIQIGGEVVAVLTVVLDGGKVLVRYTATGNDDYSSCPTTTYFIVENKKFKIMTDAWQQREAIRKFIKAKPAS